MGVPGCSAWHLYRPSRPPRSAEFPLRDFWKPTSSALVAGLFADPAAPSLQLQVLHDAGPLIRTSGPFSQAGQLSVVTYEQSLLATHAGPALMTASRICAATPYE